MKRLRSSEDLDSHGEKGASKDSGWRDEDVGLSRSSSHRNFYYKSENGRKGLSSSSPRFDRLEDDRDSSRSIRKWPDHDADSYDRRKSHDRHRESTDKGILSSSPWSSYGVDRMYRPESFSGPRREFPKGFRSERDRSRGEGSFSSWRRFSGAKDADEGNRSAGDSVRGSKVALDDVEKARSPRGVREAKSPPWSKDSESEQSKSIEAKKSEDLPVESGNSSEMEEGELEPDPVPVTASEPVAEDQTSVDLILEKELDSEHQADNNHLETGEKLSTEVNVLPCNMHVCEENLGVRQTGADQGDMKEADLLPNSKHDTNGYKDVNEALPGHEVGENEECARANSRDDNEGKEEPDNASAEKSSKMGHGLNKFKGVDLEVTAEEMALSARSKGVTKDYLAAGIVPSLVTEERTQNLMDRGKSVAVSPSNITVSVEGAQKIEKEKTSFLTCRENDLEGPSSRGFELFFADPVKKLERAEHSGHSGLDKPQEKPVLEPLDLSLSLPNVLLPIGSHSTAQAPGSPSHTVSVQSLASTFRTNSDGFTASMSFSGSQPFTHNPSCSLTHNSFDNYEQSVKSKPLFQGVDWRAQSSVEHNKDVVMLHGVLSNGSGFYHQSQIPQGTSNGLVQEQRIKNAEGSSRVPVGLDRQLSFQKHLPGVQSRHLNDVRSPSHSAGSRETASEYSKDRKKLLREKNGDSLCRSSNRDEKEQLLTGGSEFVESIIAMIVSEPLHIMSRRLNEMTGQSMASLKESVRDAILNPSKSWQLSAFQKALEDRSDITLELLLKTHRAQLEILVTLKTGLEDFLHRNYDISSSDLAEVFLNLRCRNLRCRSILPVDECDCKACSQKNGFCSACMCLVCSEFDMAANTCSWVGCDVCLHWCHADCALRKAYIRNGHSVTGAQGTTEMQFHCVACDHPSEMFGFVKEVFQNFLKDWSTETVRKELEYVRKIFCASEDVRGRRLHEIAIQMLSRLTNKSDLQVVKRQIMSFLAEADSFKAGNLSTVSEKELAKKLHEEENNGIAIYSEKMPQLERAAELHHNFDIIRNGKHTANADSQRNAQKEPVFDELESIVRIKEAEAKMFQARADEARREAEGLKRISVAKNEKIEEEYTIRVTKLRLAEAEELRKQKLKELQALERAHREYFNMKIRMEADIRDLLSKMEATKRNLPI